MNRATLLWAAGAVLISLDAAKANYYTYDVAYTINTVSVTGSITTNCDNSCALSSTNVTSWGFVDNLGDKIYSTDSGAYISTGTASPLTATPTGITYTANLSGLAVIYFYDDSLELNFTTFYSSNKPGNELYFFDGSNQNSAAQNASETIATPSPVPGPLVGAGFPGVIAGFGGMLAWWRRRAWRRSGMSAPIMSTN